MGCGSGTGWSGVKGGHAAAEVLHVLARLLAVGVGGFVGEDLTRAVLVHL